MYKNGKWFRPFRDNQKGFTLVELMIVVVIIGILVSTAVPLYGKITAKAEEKANDANIRIILGAIDMYRAEHGFDTKPSLEDLAGEYISENVTPPKSYGIKYRIDYVDGKPSVETVKQGGNGESNED